MLSVVMVLVALYLLALKDAGVLVAWTYWSLRRVFDSLESLPNFTAEGGRQSEG